MKVRRRRRHRCPEHGPRAPEARAPGEAAVLAFLPAGNDLLLMPADLDEAAKGLLDGPGPQQSGSAGAPARVGHPDCWAFKLPGWASHPDGGGAKERRCRGPPGRRSGRRGRRPCRTQEAPCSGPAGARPGQVSVTASNGRAQQVAWLSAALKEPRVWRWSLGVGAAGAPGRVRRRHRRPLARGAAVTVAMDTPYLLRSATSAGADRNLLLQRGIVMRALAASAGWQGAARGRSPVPVTRLAHDRPATADGRVLGNVAHTG